MDSDCAMSPSRCSTFPSRVRAATTYLCTSLSSKLCPRRSCGSARSIVSSGFRSSPQGWSFSNPRDFPGSPFPPLLSMALCIGWSAAVRVFLDYEDIVGTRLPHLPGRVLPEVSKYPCPPWGRGAGGGEGKRRDGHGTRLLVGFALAWPHVVCRVAQCPNCLILNGHCRRSCRPQPRGSGGDATPRKDTRQDRGQCSTQVLPDVGCRITLKMSDSQEERKPGPTGLTWASERAPTPGPVFPQVPPYYLTLRVWTSSLLRLTATCPRSQHFHRVPHMGWRSLVDLSDGDLSEVVAGYWTLVTCGE